jgi:hypothetical protein
MARRRARPALSSPPPIKPPLGLLVIGNPEKALSDGPQSLYPEQFDRLMRELRIIAPVLGRTLPLAKAKAWKRQPSGIAERPRYAPRGRLVPPTSSGG